MERNTVLDQHPDVSDSPYQSDVFFDNVILSADPWSGLYCESR